MISQLTAFSFASSACASASLLLAASSSFCISVTRAALFCPSTAAWCQLLRSHEAHSFQLLQLSLHPLLSALGSFEVLLQLDHSRSALLTLLRSLPVSFLAVHQLTVLRPSSLAAASFSRLLAASSSFCSSASLADAFSPSCETCASATPASRSAHDFQLAQLGRRLLFPAPGRVELRLQLGQSRSALLRLARSLASANPAVWQLTALSLSSSAHAPSSRAFAASSSFRSSATRASAWPSAMINNLADLGPVRVGCAIHFRLGSQLIPTTAQLTAMSGSGVGIRPSPLAPLAPFGPSGAGESVAGDPLRGVGAPLSVGVSAAAAAAFCFRRAAS